MRAKIVSRPPTSQRLRLNLPSIALDISADLPELTRCPVALVSAGVKSILDIGRFVVRFFDRSLISYVTNAGR